jgi:hypothetical protein
VLGDGDATLDMDERIQLPTAGVDEGVAAQKEADPPSPAGVDEGSAAQDEELVRILRVALLVDSEHTEAPCKTCSHRNRT